MRLSDLGGSKEVAEALGVNYRSLYNYRRQHWDFPVAIHHVAATPLWDLGQIRDWKVKYEARKDKGGAPRGNTNAKASNEARRKAALLKKHMDEL